MPAEFKSFGVGENEPSPAPEAAEAEAESCPTREMCKSCYSEENGLNFIPNAKAIYNYFKAFEDGVSLTEGDKVEIVEKYNDGWTRVKKANGEVGVVATKYIEAIDPAASAA